MCLSECPVRPKSFFNHLHNAFEACVARQRPSFRYLDKGGVYQNVLEQVASLLLLIQPEVGF